MTQPTLPPFHYLDNVAQVSALAEQVRAEGLCALDTESNSFYAYFHRVCLLQISTATDDYLIDPLAVPNLAALSAAVASPGVEVVMHAAENDILLLHRDHGFRFHRVFDTLWAARVLGWPRPNLASVLESTFGVPVDKRMQRTDWGQRPLSDAQKAYARIDTHYLLPLRARQIEALQERHRWEEAQEVFAHLVEIEWQEKEAPSFWRLPGVRDLQPRQLAVLQELFDWREDTARRRDVPPFRGLGNETLLALAQAQPTSDQELRGLPGVPSRLPPHIAQRLLQAVRQGQKKPPPSPPAYNGLGRPDEATLARFDRLRAWRTTTAAARAVEPDVILTNDVLMTLARARPATSAALAALNVLGAWKLRTYGPSLLEALK